MVKVAVTVIVFFFTGKVDVKALVSFTFRVDVRVIASFAVRDDTTVVVSFKGKCYSYCFFNSEVQMLNL